MPARVKRACALPRIFRGVFSQLISFALWGRVLVGPERFSFDEGRRTARAFTRGSHCAPRGADYRLRVSGARDFRESRSRGNVEDILAATSTAGYTSNSPFKFVFTSLHAECERDGWRARGLLSNGGGRFSEHGERTGKRWRTRDEDGGGRGPSARRDCRASKRREVNALQPARWRAPLNRRRRIRHHARPDLRRGGVGGPTLLARSEERRVGKECR